MKKFLTMTLAAGFMAAPAFASSMTVSFANDDGTTVEWVLDSDGTATSGDITTAYTYDEANMVLCADIPDEGEVCVTFDGQAEAVGESAGYTGSNGITGTATIIAINE